MLANLLLRRRSRYKLYAGENTKQSLCVKAYGMPSCIRVGDNNPGCTSKPNQAKTASPWCSRRWVLVCDNHNSRLETPKSEASFDTCRNSNVDNWQNTICVIVKSAGSFYYSPGILFSSSFLFLLTFDIYSYRLAKAKKCTLRWWRKDVNCSIATPTHIRLLAIIVSSRDCTKQHLGNQGR